MTDRAVPADTTLAHAGSRRQPGEPMVQPPVLATILAPAGQPREADYGRGGNPTWAALEQALGAIESAEDDLAAIESGLGAGRAVLWAESPTNPLLRVGAVVWPGGVRSGGAAAQL